MAWCNLIMPHFSTHASTLTHAPLLPPFCRFPFLLSTWPSLQGRPSLQQCDRQHPPLKMSKRTCLNTYDVSWTEKNRAFLFIFAVNARQAQWFARKQHNRDHFLWRVLFFTFWRQARFCSRLFYLETGRGGRCALWVDNPKKKTQKTSKQKAINQARGSILSGVYWSTHWHFLLVRSTRTSFFLFLVFILLGFCWFFFLLVLVLIVWKFMFIFCFFTIYVGEEGDIPRPNKVGLGPTRISDYFRARIIYKISVLCSPYYLLTRRKPFLFCCSARGVF